MRMIHFLLVYDRRRQVLDSQEAFDDADRANAAYQELEQRYRSSPDMEIVLVGADSIETIYRTHGHYFEPLQLPVTV